MSNPSGILILTLLLSSGILHAQLAELPYHITHHCCSGMKVRSADIPVILNRECVFTNENECDCLEGKAQGTVSGPEKYYVAYPQIDSGLTENVRNKINRRILQKFQNSLFANIPYCDHHMVRDPGWRLMTDTDSMMLIENRVSAYWRCRITEYEHNYRIIYADEKYLSLYLYFEYHNQRETEDGYAEDLVDVVTFDLETGEVVDLDELVTDAARLESVLMQNWFRRYEILANEQADREKLEQIFLRRISTPGIYAGGIWFGMDFPDPCIYCEKEILICYIPFGWFNEILKPGISWGMMK